MASEGKNRGDAIEACAPAGVRPYFSEEGVRLYQGNAMRLLPRMKRECVDLVLTDPPYCSGGQTASERGADPVAKYAHSNDARGRPTFTGDHLDQRAFIRWCGLWLEDCLQVAKPSAYLAVFIDWRNIGALIDAVQISGWHWRGLIVWNKGLGARAPHKGFVRHQAEYVVWGTKGRVPKRLDAGPFPGVYNYTVKKSDKHHLTGKPTPLLRDLVKLAPAGGLVLDTFAGSCTTARAAKLEGRRSINFELSSEYCEIGARLLKETVPKAA